MLAFRPALSRALVAPLSSAAPRLAAAGVVSFLPGGGGAPSSAPSSSAAYSPSPSLIRRRPFGGTTSSSSPPSGTSEEDVAAKEAAAAIFESVWKDLVAQKGLAGLVFPREIVWLTGAPGAGKGTMGGVIMKERDITQIFEVSSLLSSPAFVEMKKRGELIGDRDVISAALVELLKPEYSFGVVVDGFPRTVLQAHAIRFLRDKLQELYVEHRNDPALRRILRRPNFSIACFYCSEEESVKRQLQRGAELSRLNKMVGETGVGHEKEVRTTDVSADAARKRYAVFKDEVYGSLQAIKNDFHFSFINADGPPEEVKKQLLAEFRYQSSHDLGEEAYEAIRGVEPASLVIKQARTLLVTRLNSYAMDYAGLLGTVVEMLKSEFIHIVRRQSLAGRAIIRSNNPVLENPIAVNMVLDILAERGYFVVLDVQRTYVPVRLEPTVHGDLNGPRITNRTEKVWVFNITFPRPQIRRND
jgi:adenylate kinase